MLFRRYSELRQSSPNEGIWYGILTSSITLLFQEIRCDSLGREGYEVLVEGGWRFCVQGCREIGWSISRGSLGACFECVEDAVARCCLEVCGHSLPARSAHARGWRLYFIKVPFRRKYLPNTFPSHPLAVGQSETLPLWTSVWSLKGWWHLSWWGMNYRRGTVLPLSSSLQGSLNCIRSCWTSWQNSCNTLPIPK